MQNRIKNKYSFSQRMLFKKKKKNSYSLPDSANEEFDCVMLWKIEKFLWRRQRKKNRSNAIKVSACNILTCVSICPEFIHTIILYLSSLAAPFLYSKIDLWIGNFAIEQIYSKLFCRLLFVTSTIQNLSRLNSLEFKKKEINW